MSANSVLAALRDAPHLSVSGVKTYLGCPMKYAFRYDLKAAASHRSSAMILGSACHAAVEKYYQEVLADRDPSAELLIDTFTSAWRAGVIGDPPVKSDDIGKDFDDGVAVIRAFRNTVVRPARVLAIEEPFALPLYRQSIGKVDDRLLLGALDAVIVDAEGRTVLVENKTARRRWSNDQLLNDPQLTVYRRVLRELGMADNPVLRLDFLLKLKEPIYEPVTVVRTDAQEQEVLHLLDEVLRAVDAGIRYRVRGWMCNDCEYGYACS